ELDATLERLWPIDTAARLRMIKGDLGRLDKLTEVFYGKALGGDVLAGTLGAKIWERKHELLGLDAVQRIDLQIINEPREAPHEFDKIYDAIMRVARGGQQPGDGNGSAENGSEGPH